MAIQRKLSKEIRSRFLECLLGGVAMSLCLGAPLAPSAFAQDLQSAKDRASKAYAADKLLKARTIRLESHVRRPFESHDYTADFHDLSRQVFHTVLDIDNEQGSHEFVTDITGTSYHGRNFVKDGQSTFIAYGPDSYQDNGEIDFFIAFGSTIRASDVALAFWINRPDTETRYLGEAMWRGSQHDVIEADFPSSPPLRIFVRREDGAITKMERTLPDDRTVYYTFQSHRTRGGVLIAREHSFYIEDEPVYFSFDRDIAVNDRRDRRAFELDPGIKLEAERTDQSEMVVLALGRTDVPGQRVHQVGQGENCTTFMVVNDGIIGFGMGAGFKERLDAYRQETGITLPLQYVIAADHHDEDIGGAAEASEAGATLWVTDQTAKKMRGGDNSYNLEVIDAAKNIGDLMILTLATDHAATTLAAYHKSQNFVMQTGHYYSSFIDGPSYARRTAVSFYEALPAFIRDAAPTVLSGQDMKAEQWPDFMSAINAHEDIRCHNNRPICKS